MLDDITRAMDQIRAARRTIYCSPEVAPRLQAAVDELAAGHLFTVEAHPFLPDGQAFVVDTQALRLGETP